MTLLTILKQGDRRQLATEWDGTGRSRDAKNKTKRGTTDMATLI